MAKHNCMTEQRAVGRLAQGTEKKRCLTTNRPTARKLTGKHSML